MKRVFILVLFVSLAFLFSCKSKTQPGQIGTGDCAVRLAWDANTEPDLDFYTVYAGTAAGTHDLTAGDTETTEFEVTGADCGTTYFFVVTASDTSGNESGTSDEVSGVAK